MALHASLPDALQEFIPAAERAPKAFAEAWRYTPMAGVELPALPHSRQQHVIKADTTLHLDVTSGATHQFDVHGGATLTLIETMPAGAPALIQEYIHIAAGARVNHVRSTHIDEDDVAVVQTHTTVAEGAAYHFYTATSGARRLRQRVQVDLVGAGASATVAAAYALAGKAHHDFAVLMNHLAPNTNSRQHIKGVVRDTARGAFQGKIHVAQAAQETEAFQLHKALLLGERAEVNAKPELEIFADRVKCSHGNAIGALDPMALFYLQARGLDLANARHLLTQAFLDETLEDAPAERDQLALYLHNLLGVSDA